MYNTIIFPTKEVDLTNYYYFAKGFSNEELTKGFSLTSSMLFPILTL